MVSSSKMINLEGPAEFKCIYIYIGYIYPEIGHVKINTDTYKKISAKGKLVP